jgi:hypothetical protein
MGTQREAHEMGSGEKPTNRAALGTNIKFQVATWGRKERSTKTRNRMSTVMSGHCCRNAKLLVQALGSESYPPFTAIDTGSQRFMVPDMEMMV